MFDKCLYGVLVNTVNFTISVIIFVEEISIIIIVEEKRTFNIYWNFYSRSLSFITSELFKSSSSSILFRNKCSFSTKKSYKVISSLKGLNKEPTNILKSHITHFFWDQWIGLFFSCFCFVYCDLYWYETILPARQS